MVSLQKHIQTLGKSDIILSFSGNLTINVINNSLLLAEKRFLEKGVKNRYIKKVYNVLVEALQNIFHHGLKNDDGTIPCLFAISFHKTEFKISFCNALDEKAKAVLEPKIDSINNMDQIEIVKEYRKVLDNGIVSDKGGSGLGFLDMKRKTKNNIEYQIFKDEEHLNFLVYLTIKIKHE